MRRWIAGGVTVAALLVLWMTASAQPTSEWIVSSDGDSGSGSLRAAILAANASKGDDLIRFASPMTIRPRSPLPALEDDGITIDGSFGLASPDVAPLVWLDGSLSDDSAGLEIIAARGTIEGLGIVGFQRYGVGVIGAAAVDAVIEGNWVGLRASGEIGPNRLSGIAVIGGARGAVVRNNRIGGNSDVGRTGHGIVVGGGGTVNVEIEGNVIGIALDGSSAPNDDGILIVDSAQATIRSNTIGYSAVAGIELRETRQDVSVDGNRLGVRRDGAAAPNDIGLFLGPRSAGAKIGARMSNIIAANRVGIAVEQGAREASIEDNWIGLVPRPGISRPGVSDLPQALVRPNHERGVSIIAGAAIIRLRNNFIAAGEYGVLVDDPTTTRVSLTGNVIAGARQAATIAAIDVRAGAEVVIGGGDKPLGNHVCGAEYGVRLAGTDEARVGHNAIGAGAAHRVTFDSDERMQWGIRLGDQTLRAQVQHNHIADAGQAAISVIGDGAQDNLLSRNRYSNNGLDIDLGADGRSMNDVRDRDQGPNGLLNHPTIEGHSVRVISARSFTSTFNGIATPGSYVEIYQLHDTRWDRIARSQPADRAGRWVARTAELPSAPIRALAMMATGATSEFSPTFLPSQRVKLRAGVNHIAWTGPEMPIEEAFAPMLPSVKTVWRWNAPEARWEGWSPLISVGNVGRGGVLERVRTGDVLRVDVIDRRTEDFFIPAGGELSEPAAIALVQGFNQVAWLGGTVDTLDTLRQLEALNPALIGHLWQWDQSRWRLIWPRVSGAWDPMHWEFATLWLRATRLGELRLP